MNSVKFHLLVLSMIFILFFQESSPQTLQSRVCVQRPDEPYREASQSRSDSQRFQRVQSNDR